MRQTIEQGYGDHEGSTWIALFVPAANPARGDQLTTADDNWSREARFAKRVCLWMAGARKDLTRNAVILSHRRLWASAL